jgi:23S rRNA (pseudouridine1915-N3)-methyltransferase
MRYRLVCVDRVRERYVASAVDDFARRLRRYSPLEIVEVPAGHGSDPQRAMHEEAAAILALLDTSDRVWLLEREGREWSTLELRDRLTALQNEGIRGLTVIVAGAFGAGGALRKRADALWSLSRLTLLHEWARALALEQLYRCAKIARGEPYHH